MGSLSDNGGSWPPDGGVPDRLPDLPPEWGDIVIPDDLSSLASEVATIRAELHREQDRTAWQRFARGVQAYDIPAIVELAVDLEARHARLMASGIAQFVLDMARRATDLDDRTRAHLATLADLSDPPRD